jgi:hypothetical protein
MVDPDAKLDRAQEHLNALDTALELFGQSKPYRITPQEDLQRLQYVVTITLDKAPLPLAMIAGDVVAAIRSSLDHLAWQLALIKTTKPSTSVCFPIYDLDTVDTHVLIAKATFQLPDAAVAIMKSLQPYKSGKAYKDTHLWRLNKLWNIDKHRHLILHSGIFDMILSRTLPKDLRPVETRKFNEGCEMRFPLAAKEHLNLDPEFSFAITFGDRGEGIEIGADGLREIYNFVRHEVFPRFAGLFA